jgi:hypothetical protein
MIAEVPCPSCEAAAALVAYSHIVRRGDRSVSVTWHRYVCPGECRSERDGGVFEFVTAAVHDANVNAAEAAWVEKFGEPIPAPGRPGRPPRAGTKSTERVPVLFTTDELDEIDRRRGDLSRSAYVRKAALGGRRR